MKTFNDNSDIALTNEMNSLLSSIRLKKKFNPEVYLKYKKFAVSSYLKKHNIDSVVIGISGGIDSAVALGILKSIKDDGGIKNIYAVSMPAFKSKGAVSNQDEAWTKYRAVVNHFDILRRMVDLSDTLTVLGEDVRESLNSDGTPWSNGQLVPNLRTAASYYITSLLSDKDQKAVVIGTINRSEGSYLGYMGKAGDALVDIQLISDLYKSEVYQLAKYFNIPDTIISAIPNGDMHDNRSDEQVFGATYDFVELYLSYLQDRDIINSLDKESLDKFNLLGSRLESVHNHNAHKYISSSPAIHLDLYDTRIEGGWKNNSTYNMDNPLDPNRLINFIPVSNDQIDDLYEFSDYKDDLSFEESKILLSFVDDIKWAEADKNGKVSNSLLADEICSYRATVYSKSLSTFFDKKVKNMSNWEEFVIRDDELYRYVGVSNSFRYIRYKVGGKLVPHYDGAYSFSNKKKTIFSMVIYLERADLGGDTVFLNETRENHNFEDWTDYCGNYNSDEYHDDESHRDPTSIMIFDHKTLHASSPVLYGRKTIIRTDLVYEKVC